MIGDYLSDKNGEEILIESIEILTGEFTVFNLDVEENDLYIANGILTHNAKAV
jgi:intein/homing endonuclease